MLTLHFPSEKWAGASKWVPLIWEVVYYVTPDPQYGKPTYALLVRSPYSRTSNPLDLHSLCHEKPSVLMKWLCEPCILVLNGHLSNSKGVIGGPSYGRVSPHGMGEIHHRLRGKGQTTNLPAWQRNMVSFKLKSPTKVPEQRRATIESFENMCSIVSWPNPL